LVFKGRVFGTLAVSRALGDAGLKNPDYVSAEPHIMSIELQPDDRFMVLACDGLWDKFSYTDAVEYVAKLQQQGSTPHQVSEALVAEALTRNSLDNITVVVVYFQWS